jgi:hypothetical protein
MHFLLFNSHMIEERLVSHEIHLKARPVGCQAREMIEMKLGQLI